jgi:hypothetical protein
MAAVTYSRDITGLVLIDPYNEANDCVPHRKQVVDAARSANIRVF